MKSARAILETMKLRITGDPPEDDEELGSLVSSIQRYSENADRYVLRDSDRVHCKHELESIIEDAAQALAILSGD